MLAGQAVRGVPLAARPARDSSVALPTRRPVRSLKQVSRSAEAASSTRVACHVRQSAAVAAPDGLMASKGPAKPRRNVKTQASHTVQASYASPDNSRASLTPVLLAVAVASLGALLFGLHLAVVNGIQDAVSTELGFFTNTGLRGAVRHFHAVHVLNVCLLGNTEVSQASVLCCR